MCPVSEPSPVDQEVDLRNAANHEIAIDPQQQRRGRLKLLAIIALFGIPLLMATVWLQVVRQTGGNLGSTSRGQLITPAVPLEPFALTDASQAGTSGADAGVANGSGASGAANGDTNSAGAIQAVKAFELDNVRGLWTLMYAPAGDCADTCQHNLYNMRQVRLALNHRMNRVQRAVLVPADRPLAETLVAEHPGLIIATGSADNVDAFKAQISSAQVGMDPLADAIFLIDPLGNLMMRFPPNLPAKSLLKDLKHLLKVSRIG